jgi:hypothetical protein
MLVGCRLAVVGGGGADRCWRGGGCRRDGCLRGKVTSCLVNGAEPLEECFTAFIGCRKVEAG